STPFPITTQGTTIVTWSFNDGNGQIVTADQNVIIDDTVAPALPNITAQCSVTPNAPTATVFCNETLTGTTTSTFPITTQGTTIVTWTFDDGNGNTTTQTQNVIIDDTTAPVADIASLPNVTGQNSVTVNAPTATDACKGTVTATTTSPLTYSTPGTYSIVWTYDDENGNTSTQNQTVIILDAIAPTQPTSLSASSTTTTTTNLIWTASTDNISVIGYDVYRGTALIASVAATNYAVTGLTANTAYTFSVIAKDAAGNASISSNIVNVTTLANAVVYCTSKGTSTTREKIGKVVLGSINNTSTGTAGYENFTAIATNATRGTAYTITITPSWTSSKRSEGYAVWIDYNADGDFADTGELVFSRAASTTTPISGTFTIPTTATIGATRMRVSMKYTGIPTACETFASGQVEDYTVTIVSSTARIAAKTNDSISSTILVYPNPTTGILNVTETSSTATYIIYNLIGQSIMKGNLSNNIIDVSNITTGNYLLEITDNGNITSKRIIKQ
ncbi:secretion protein, partial [Flavobacterium alvei]